MIVKTFSKSTIFGLTLGVFLAAYAAFAFTAPTAVPPGDNVDAPLNVGPDSQTKLGTLTLNDLWLNNGLVVQGAIKVGSFTTAGRPLCDGSTMGTFIFDSDRDKPYVCASASNWKPLDSDGDEDGQITGDGLVPNGPNAGATYDCDDNNANVIDAPDGSCDGDSDGFADSGAGGPDCYDANASANPNQTAYFTSNRGDGSFDYDCNGSQEVNLSDLGPTGTFVQPHSFSTVWSDFFSAPCLTSRPSGSGGVTGAPSCGGLTNHAICMGFTTSSCDGSGSAQFWEACPTSVAGQSALSWKVYIDHQDAGECR